MTLPPRKSMLFLSLFLLVYGGSIALSLHEIPGVNRVIQSVTGLLAIAAGVFLWIER
ncbi:MAG: hypothetical protein Q8K78_16850 [Planctomycetaceae bacterium]|nr:hypothetical protein [Planctomycetaceae bacterium]